MGGLCRLGSCEGGSSPPSRPTMARTRPFKPAVGLTDPLRTPSRLSLKPFNVCAWVRGAHSNVAHLVRKQFCPDTALAGSGETLAEATDPWRKVSFFRPETKVTEQPLVKPVIALKLCQL